MKNEIIEPITVNQSKDPFFKRTRIRIVEFVKAHKVDSKYLLFSIPIIAIFFVARAVQMNQSLNSEAGNYTATVSFQLSNWTLPPQSTFGLWVNSNGPTAFTAVEFNFDPKLIRMTSEPVLTNTKLTKIVKVTSMAEANTTGKVSIVLGLDPAQKANAPTGAFQIADVNFEAVTTNPNILTAITFNTGAMQIVALDQSVITVSSTNLNLTLNPVATPSPTATVAPTPTKTPVAKSCKSCHKNVCDGVCSKSDNRSTCSDCP